MPKARDFLVFIIVPISLKYKILANVGGSQGEKKQLFCLESVDLVLACHLVWASGTKTSDNCCWSSQIYEFVSLNSPLAHANIPIFPPIQYIKNRISTI